MYLPLSSFLVDCKQSFFFSKSVKKSVECGVRVLCERSSLASHALRRLFPVSLYVFSLVPDLLFDCFRVLECAKMRTVLQSSLLATWSLSKKQSVLRFLSGFLTFILWLRLLFQGSLSPSYILPSCNACCLPYPDKNTRNNQCFDSTLLKRAYKAFEWEEKFVWVMRWGLIRRRLFLESVRGAITRTRVVWR